MSDLSLENKESVSIKDNVSEALVISPKKLIKETTQDPAQIRAKSAQAQVKWLDNHLDCFNIPDVFFTNMLCEEKILVDPFIIEGLDMLKKNPEIVLNQSSQVKYNEKELRGQRIRKIISQYLPDEVFLEFEDNFRKTDIRTNCSISLRGTFRVISLINLENKQWYVYIIFLDPYHLFLPSEDSKKKKTWEENGKDMYSCRKDYNKTFKDHNLSLI